MKIRNYILVVSAACLLILLTVIVTSTGENANSSKDKIHYFMNEKAVTGQCEITAVGIDASLGEWPREAKEGYQFVGMKFEIKNTMDKDLFVNAKHFFEIFVDGLREEWSVKADAILAPEIKDSLEKTLKPGESHTGYLAVEIPVTAKEIDVRFNEAIGDNEYKEYVFCFDNPDI